MNTDYVYLVGSLRNPNIPIVAEELRRNGIQVFDDWFAAGERADDSWQEYEAYRDRSYTDALAGAHAQNVFEFDKRHIDEAMAVVLVLPAGKSGHLELGYAIGSGKPGYILLDGEPDRYEVMYAFANAVFSDLSDLVDELEERPWRRSPGLYWADYV